MVKEVPVETVVTKTEVKEVPVQTVVTQTQIKEVPVEKIVTQEKIVTKTVPIERVVTREVIKEVVKEVPAEREDGEGALARGLVRRLPADGGRKDDPGASKPGSRTSRL